MSNEGLLIFDSCMVNRKTRPKMTWMIFLQGSLSGLFGYVFENYFILVFTCEEFIKIVFFCKTMTFSFFHSVTLFAHYVVTKIELVTHQNSF